MTDVMRKVVSILNVRAHTLGIDTVLPVVVFSTLTTVGVYCLV